MDAIKMNGMVFYGFHGAMKEEAVLGQKFVLDVTLFLDLKAAGESDLVADTVHYGEAYEVVKYHAQECRYQLIEALAEQTAKGLLEKFEKLVSVKVAVHKPAAPVIGIFDDFTVEIERGRYA